MNALPPSLVLEFKDSIDRITKGRSTLGAERVRMMDAIEASGYKPPEGTEGTLQDFGSHDRINLILSSNVEMRHCHRQMMEGQVEGALDAYPAQELLPDSDGWEDIWDDARDKLGATTTATKASSGRMVALKGDRIWTAISDFGQPHPPFKLNFPVAVEDVDYQDAVDQGAMGKDDPSPTPPSLAAEVPLIGCDSDFIG